MLFSTSRSLPICISWAWQSFIPEMLLWFRHPFEKDLLWPPCREPLWLGFSSEVRLLKGESRPQHADLQGCIFWDFAISGTADGHLHDRGASEKLWVERCRPLTPAGKTAVDSMLGKFASATWTSHFFSRPGLCLSQIFRLTEGSHTVLSFGVALEMKGLILLDGSFHPTTGKKELLSEDLWED